MSPISIFHDAFAPCIICGADTVPLPGIFFIRWSCTNPDCPNHEADCPPSPPPAPSDIERRA
jgi:hypothetical protein